MSHPQAGGAELVNEELAKRLVQDGHEVIFLTSSYKNSRPEEDINGYRVIRVGNKFTVYYRAFKYYKKNLKAWPDLVIDEVNTIPFFSNLYAREKRYLFFHQLCREVWFYQMIFPFSLIGYLLEPVYLRLLKKEKIITVSNSTKNDLIRYGFKKENISIIREGIEIEPIKEINNYQKFSEPTILILGSIRPMKRTKDIIKAFEIAKQEIHNLQLIIAGQAEGGYGREVVEYIKKSVYTNDIEHVGRVSTEEKINLYRQSYVLGVASIKEGWGLVVTEAASQGTPAVVYNVDGLRDSVKQDQTGLICEENNPNNMAKQFVRLLQDQDKYRGIQQKAWEWSRDINFNNCYQDFINIIQGR